MVVLLEGSPISTEELELCQSDHLVPDRGPSPLIAQFGRVASSRKSLGGPKLFPFKNDGGTFNAADIFWYTSPDLCLDTIPSRSSTDYSFDLMAWFCTCTVNFGTFLYRQVCAFPNHVQSIEFNTPSCGNMSRIINGNWMHLSSISSPIAKGLNTYVNRYLSFLYISKNLFSLCHYGVLCVDC